MGFLIFAYRKLTLKRDINQKEYRLMCLSREQNRLHEQMSIMEQAKGQLQDAWGLISSNMTSMTNTIFQNKMSSTYADFNNIKGKDANDTISQQMKFSDSYGTGASKMLMAYQATQMAQLEMNHSVNSVFDAQEKSATAALHIKDQQYDQEKASLESQLKKLNSELDNVEKAESDSAKKCAPNFGLS